MRVRVRTKRMSSRRQTIPMVRSSSERIVSSEPARVTDAVEVAMRCHGCS